MSGRISVESHACADIPQMSGRLTVAVSVGLFKVKMDSLVFKKGLVKQGLLNVNVVLAVSIKLRLRGKDSL